MAEQLAKHTGLKLKAIMVVPDKSHSAEAELSIQQGQNLLRQKWTDEVFSIEEGTASKVLLARASKDHSLLVIGAYGYRNP
ncbi:hypothetical protein ABTN18_20210, partial [Acinetobacter baumannii]